MEALDKAPEPVTDRHGSVSHWRAAREAAWLAGDAVTTISEARAAYLVALAKSHLGSSASSPTGTERARWMRRPSYSSALPLVNAASIASGSSLRHATVCTRQARIGQPTESLEVARTASITSVPVRLPSRGNSCASWYAQHPAGRVPVRAVMHSVSLARTGSHRLAGTRTHQRRNRRACIDQPKPSTTTSFRSFQARFRPVRREVAVATRMPCQNRSCTTQTGAFIVHCVIRGLVIQKEYRYGSLSRRTVFPTVCLLANGRQRSAAY
jgi:hypothetical protein